MSIILIVMLSLVTLVQWFLLVAGLITNNKRFKNKIHFWWCVVPILPVVIGFLKFCVIAFGELAKEAASSYKDIGKNLR